MESIILNLMVLPAAIFFIRIVDVSLATVRLIFISRGIRFFSAILGFFEVLVWLVAVSQIIQNLNSPVHYIAYAAGFGMGNFVGVSIEKRLSYGHRIITVITQKDSSQLIESFRRLKYGVTAIGGEGAKGPVKLIFSVVRKGQVETAIKAIKKFNPKAFYTIEDIKTVSEEAEMAQMKKAGLPAFARTILLKRK